MSRPQLSFLKDQCQELTFPDADFWPIFFHRIGVELFGEEYSSKYDLYDLVEVPNETHAETVLARTN